MAMGVKAAGSDTGTLWARTVVMGVLALLFVLRGVAPDLHAVANDLRDDASLAGLGCVTDARDVNGVPRHGEGQPPCCLLCVERLADAAIPKPVASHQNDEYAPRAESVFAPAEPARRQPIRSAVGWGSSWSSQAPPAFS